MQTLRVAFGLSRERAHPAVVAPVCARALADQDPATETLPPVTVANHQREAAILTFAEFRS